MQEPKEYQTIHTIKSVYLFITLVVKFTVKRHHNNNNKLLLIKWLNEPHGVVGHHSKKINATHKNVTVSIYQTVVFLFYNHSFLIVDTTVLKKEIKKRWLLKKVCTKSRPAI